MKKSDYIKAYELACDMVSLAMAECPDWCPFQYDSKHKCIYRECEDGEFWKEYFLKEVLEDE